MFFVSSSSAIAVAASHRFQSFSHYSGDVMGRIYTTIQGEMLDAICRKIYGGESGYVEQVLEANPGLAALSHRLPMGTRINLPDLVRAEQSQSVVALWS